MSATMTESLEVRTLNTRSLSPRLDNTSSANEHFPVFEEESRRSGLSQVSASPFDTASPIVPEYKWPARSNSGRLSRAGGNRHRRSVSEALNRFRDRRGSVSENAQELAEALKAPVSYKLIVCVRGTVQSTCANDCRFCVSFGT
jgi:hypothetical protein